MPQSCTNFFMSSRSSSAAVIFVALLLWMHVPAGHSFVSISQRVLNSIGSNNNVNSNNNNINGNGPSSPMLMKSPKLDDWKVLTNGRVVGTVFDHPSIPDGDIITTSPIVRPDQVAEKKLVTTISGSKYVLGKPQFKKDASSGVKMSIKELQKRAKVAFGLSGEVVGDDVRQYLLVGKPTMSTSRKSFIYKAYKSDEDGLPEGEALTVKMSSNWEAIEREADNYAKITKAGFLRGQFIELIDFLPTASIITPKFKTQSALVMERGAVDLKRYIAVNGPLEGKVLRDAASAAVSCVQAIHGSGLVWTDMKTENFVVTKDEIVKGIDLESAMPIRDNPVDYSPEGTPPEFATAFLAGDGPYFVLDYSYDIWSLGMLFYELSTGRGYFDGKTPVQITKALRDGIDINLDAVPDESLKDLISKCLQVDAKKRANIIQVSLHPFFLKRGFFNNNNNNNAAKK